MPPHRVSYSQRDLEIAADKVRRKELTNAEASRVYGIPTSTLSDRVRQNTLNQTNVNLGRPTVIPTEMEKSLACCLRTMEKWGWGLSREEVLDLVQDFIKRNKLVTPFCNDRPGGDWFIGFRKRHCLSIKKPQPVEYLRKKNTDPFITNKYFTLLENTLTELNLDDPHRIWNLDETSVCLDPTKTKVVGAVGSPCVRTTAGSGRENITVLAAVNAAGEKLNPLLIYKGKHLYKQWMTIAKPEHNFELAYAATKRGWIDTETFYNYMSKVMIPNLGDERPVLIIYDGHTTHVDEKVVKLAVDNDITILKLPAHTSHLLQPLDLAVFKSFKNLWDMKLVQWQRQNIGVKIQKQQFAEMFADAWHKLTPNVIKSGFKKGGIYPFNSAVIPKEKFDPNAYKRWTIHMSKQQIMPLTKLCIDVINKSMTDRQTPSFEQLLLEKIAQQPRTQANKTTQRLNRVATGAEVITHTFIEQQKVSDDNETHKSRKTKKTVQKAKATPNSQNKKQNCNTSDTEIAGPSGLQVENEKTKKKKLQKMKDTTAGTSMILTERNGTTCDITTKGKGKGKGKKSKTGKENRLKVDQKKSGVTQKPRKKKEKSSSIATTPESVIMSLRSESDIHSLPDVFLNDNYSLDDFEHLTRELEIEKIVDEMYDADRNLITVNKPLQKPDSGILESSENIGQPCEELRNPSQGTEKVTILSAIRYAPENQAFYIPKAKSRGNLNRIDQSFDIFSGHNKRKGVLPVTTNSEPKKRKLQKADASVESDERDDKKMFETFKVRDVVLCRYHTKGWKYYVGVIESLNFKSETYTICFYKTIIKNDFIKFIIPKRLDQDNVPVSNVVKTIELLQFNESPAEFTLMNDEESHYFK